MQIESRAHRERLDDVLQQPVGEDHDHEHDRGGRRSVRAEGDDDGERAGDERPDVGDVRRDRRDDADGSGERHAEDQRADGDDEPVEHGDDGDAAEVAAQRRDDAARHGLRDRHRQPKVPVDPSTHRRSVLQDEEEGQQREGKSEGERRDAFDAVDDALRQRRDDLRHRRTRRPISRSASPTRRRRRCSASFRPCRRPPSHACEMSPSCDVMPPSTRTRMKAADRSEPEQNDRLRPPLVESGGVAGSRPPAWPRSRRSSRRRRARRSRRWFRAAR